MQAQTVCQNCCFADFHGIVQTGCRAGQLDNYKDKGYKVEFLDKGYYSIDTVCRYHRSKEWGEGRENPVEDAYQEILPVWTALVRSSNDKDLIMKTYMGLRAIPEVNDIHVVTSIPQLSATISPTLDKNSSVTTTYDNDHLKILKLLATKNPYGFFYLCNAGFVPKADTFTKINHLVVDTLYKAPVIFPDDDDNGLIIAKSVFLYLWYEYEDKSKIIETLYSYKGDSICQLV